MRSILVAVVLCSLSSAAGARNLASVMPEPGSGRMVIAYDDGHQVFVGRCGDEATFSLPRRSRDGQTVAWTAMSDYDDLNSQGSTLILYHQDHVLSRIEAEPTIASWDFYGHGRWIGITSKPIPGQLATCSIYDARTGGFAGSTSAQATPSPCAAAFRPLGPRD